MNLLPSRLFVLSGIFLAVTIIFIAAPNRLGRESPSGKNVRSENQLRGRMDEGTAKNPVQEQRQEEVSPTALPGEERGEPTMDSLEQLATHDASRALSIALAQGDPSVRHAFLLAVIRGWARTDVNAAGKWVLAQTHMEQVEALGALFNGAAVEREKAVGFCQQISREQTARAETFGQVLISSLGQAGEYERAAQFAGEEQSNLAVKFITDAFRQWSEQTPEPAVLAALRLKTPEARSFALQSAVPVWARLDPRALAEIARDFPAGPEKTLILSVTLRAWMENDIEGAYVWIKQWEPSGALSAVDLKFVLEE